MTLKVLSLTASLLPSASTGLIVILSHALYSRDVTFLFTVFPVYFFNNFIYYLFCAGSSLLCRFFSAYGGGREWRGATLQLWNVGSLWGLLSLQSIGSKALGLQ